MSTLFPYRLDEARLRPPPAPDELEIMDPFIIHLRIEGRLARCLIDTGCTSLLMDEALCAKGSNS